MFMPAKLRTPLVWGSLSFSLAAGAAAQALIAYAAEDFAQHWFRQPMVLLAVHLGTLGFLVPLVFGVLTQFMPMLLGRTFAYERALPYLLGFLGLAVAGVWLYLGGWREGGLAWGAGLSVTAVVAAFGTLAWPAIVYGGISHRLSRATLASSFFYLFWTVLLGSFLAQGLIQPPLIAGEAFSLIALHLHLGLFGFGSLAVFGVSYELLPMFNLAKGVPWFWGWVALSFAHLGMIFITLATLGPAWAVVLGHAWPLCLALSVASYLWQIRVLLAQAMRRKREANGVQFRVAWAFLALTTLLGLTLSFQAQPTLGAHAAYVYLLLFGFLGGAIFSQLQKIVPLLSWYDRFAPYAGRSGVPTAAQLLDERLAWATPFLHGATVLCGALGLLLSLTWLIRLSGLLGSLFFGAQAVLMLGSRVRGKVEARLAPSAVPLPIEGSVQP